MTRRRDFVVPRTRSTSRRAAASARWRALALAPLALALATASAHATNINVTTTADENSSTPPNGNCSLREAIIAANNNVAVDACPAGSKPIDVISVPAGTYTLTLGSGDDIAELGDLDILGETQILGAGASSTIIDGNGLDRVFHTLAFETTNVSISGVTIRHGTTEGILQQTGNLTVTNSTIELNSGYGIYANTYASVASSTLRLNGNAAIETYAAEISVIDTLVEGNTCPSTAAITNLGSTLTVTRATVRNNACANGGVMNGGFGTITDSTIEGNGPLATNAGAVTSGCIGWSCSSSLTVERTTISGNLGDGFVPTRGAYQLLNSTISGNTGRGMLVVSGGVTVTHSTIAQNGGLAIDNENGGIFGPSSTKLGNSIVQGACLNVASTLASAGGNVESPGNTCLLTDPSDQVSVASLGLGALGSYGGSTKTHSLSSSSPAVGAGLAGNCLATDQRGIARPAPATGDCDAGAYELTGCGASFTGAGFAIPALVLMRRRRRNR